MQQYEKKARVSPPTWPALRGFHFELALATVHSKHRGQIHLCEYEHLCILWSQSISFFINNVWRCAKQTLAVNISARCTKVYPSCFSKRRKTALLDLPVSQRRCASCDRCLTEIHIHLQCCLVVAVRNSLFMTIQYFRIYFMQGSCSRYFGEWVFLCGCKQSRITQAKRHQWNTCVLVYCTVAPNVLKAAWNPCPARLIEADDQAQWIPWFFSLQLLLLCYRFWEAWWF